MWRSLAILAACLGATALGCGEEPRANVNGPSESKTKANDADKEDPKAKEKTHFEKDIQGLREGAEKRIIGVKLTTTAEVKDQNIQISWTVDYTGQRPPLVMLKPMFPNSTDGSTFIRVFVPTEGEKTCIVRSLPDGQRSMPYYSTEMFVTVEKGKTHSETLVVPVTRLKSALEKEWPEFDKSTPPARCYIQLHHVPRERGNHLMRKPGQSEPDVLDAWTGDLDSTVMKIKLEKW